MRAYHLIYCDEPLITSFSPILAISQIPIQQVTRGLAEDGEILRSSILFSRYNVPAIKIKAVNGFSVSFLLEKWMNGKETEYGKLMY